MFIWINVTEIGHQIISLGKKLKDIESQIQKAVDRSWADFVFRIDKKMWQDIQFFDEIRDRDEKIRLAKLLLKLQGPIEVFVYPTADYIDTIIECIHTCTIEKLEKQDTDKGSLVKINKKRAEECQWCDMKWSAENPQLIEMMGFICIDTMCFYPFKRPTNNSVAVRLNIDRDDFMTYRLGSTGMDPFVDKYSMKRNYTLCVGKVVNSSIKPLIFFDRNEPKGDDRMRKHVTKWLENLDIERLYDWDLPNWPDYIPKICESIANGSYKSIDKSDKGIPYISNAISPMPIREYDGETRIKKLIRTYILNDIHWACDD